MDPTKWYDAQTQQYYPYAHLPPNPSPIVAAAPAPAPVGTHVYDAHGAGAAVGPPGADAHAASHAYAPHGGYEGHAVSYMYPPAEAPPYYHGFGGGDAQSFPAKDTGGQYGVHPVAQGDVLGRPPSVPIYQNNKPTHPSQNGIIWKKKKKIPKTVQSVYCEVCKIACNSQEVLNSHRCGKKHKKNLEKLKESIAPNHAKAPTKKVENKKVPESEDKAEGDKTKKKPAIATEVDLETKKRKVLKGGAAANAVKVCTLCNVVCNSEVVFNFHIAGQKHAAMMKKQQGASVS